VDDATTGIERDNPALKGVLPKKGGEFYTPRCVVKLLVEILEPYRGRNKTYRIPIPPASLREGVV